MRKFILFSLAIGLCILAWGQGKEPFCCTKAGTELVYQTLDPKGNETGQSITTIDAVSGSDGNYTITQTTTVYSGGQAITKPVPVTATVVNGDCSVVLGGGLALDVNSDVPLLPARLAVGLDLGTGNLILNVSGMKMTQSITSNKCVAREEITTTAGTFDCYVVEQSYTAKLGPIKVNGSTKTYYSRGIGMVKQQSLDKRGKVTSEQVLTSIK